MSAPEGQRPYPEVPSSRSGSSWRTRLCGSGSLAGAVSTTTWSSRTRTRAPHGRARASALGTQVYSHHLPAGVCSARMFMHGSWTHPRQHALPLDLRDTFEDLGKIRFLIVLLVGIAATALQTLSLSTSERSRREHPEHREKRCDRAGVLGAVTSSCCRAAKCDRDLLRDHPLPRDPGDLVSRDLDRSADLAGRCRSDRSRRGVAVFAHGGFAFGSPTIRLLAETQAARRPTKATHRDLGAKCRDGRGPAAPAPFFLGPRE